MNHNSSLKRRWWHLKKKSMYVSKVGSKPTHVLKISVSVSFFIFYDNNMRERH